MEELVSGQHKGMGDLREILAREFPIVKSCAYFDSATYGPHPRSYIEAVTQSATELSTALIGDIPDPADDVRAAAARLTRAPIGNIALLRSTGEGINLVAAGLDWAPGDEVILYELEFVGAVTPWLALQDRGVKINVIRDRGRYRFDIEDVERLLTPRTRAICVSLVNNKTGFRAPVEAIGKLCRERGIWFVVDAVQAIGVLDVDVAALGADVVAAHGYKFLLSGFGYAVVYCSDRALQELRIPHVGHKNVLPDHVESLLSALAHPHGGGGLTFPTSAARFEPTVQSYPAMAGFGRCIDLLNELGIGRIEEQVKSLGARLVAGLEDRGYTVVSSQIPDERSGIVSAQSPERSPQEVQRHLLAHSIVCAVRGGLLRFAPHVFNTVQEVDRLLESLLPPP